MMVFPKPPWVPPGAVTVLGYELPEGGYSPAPPLLEIVALVQRGVAPGAMIYMHPPLATPWGEGAPWVVLPPPPSPEQNGAPGDGTERSPGDGTGRPVPLIYAENGCRTLMERTERTERYFSLLALWLTEFCLKLGQTEGGTPTTTLFIYFLLFYCSKEGVYSLKPHRTVSRTEGRTVPLSPCGTVPCPAPPSGLPHGFMQETRGTPPAPPLEYIHPCLSSCELHLHQQNGHCPFRSPSVASRTDTVRSVRGRLLPPLQGHQPPLLEQRPPFQHHLQQEGS